MSTDEKKPEGHPSNLSKDEIRAHHLSNLGCLKAYELAEIIMERLTDEDLEAIREEMVEDWEENEKAEAEWLEGLRKEFEGLSDSGLAEARLTALDNADRARLSDPKAHREWTDRVNRINCETARREG